VANEVETEQIVYEASTTGFYGPLPLSARDEAKGSQVRANGSGILVPSIRDMCRCVRVRSGMCDSTCVIDGC